MLDNFMAFAVCLAMVSIVLFTINSRYHHSSLALLYLNKALSLAGHTPEILEFGLQTSDHKILADILAQNPDILFASVYIWNTVPMQRILQDLASIDPNLKIICGGPEIEYNIAFWKEQTHLSYLIQGPGEWIAAELLALPKASEPQVLRAEQNPPAAMLSVYSANTILGLPNRTVYFESSRGCHYHCTYCLSSVQPNAAYRPIDTVKKELTVLATSSVKTVKFVDRSFNCNKQFAYAIWDFLMQLNTKVQFHFELHPAFLDKDCIDLLKKAKKGLFHFEVGIQSTDETVLKLIRRQPIREEQWQFLKTLCSYTNIAVHLDQIAGLPGSSLNSEQKTLNDILALKPDEFQLGFLKVLHGTQLHIDAPCFGILASSQAPYEVLKTATLRFEDLHSLHITERLIKHFYNKHYFNETLDYVIPLFPSIYDFFNALTPYSQDSFQWQDLAANILAMTKALLHLHHCNVVIDLLRMDFQAFAKSQHYPDQIKLPHDEKVKELRQVLFEQWPAAKNLARSEKNRSHLYIPVTEYAKTRTQQSAYLFVSSEKKCTIPLSFF